MKRFILLCVVIAAAVACDTVPEQSGKRADFTIVHGMYRWESDEAICLWWVSNGGMQCHWKGAK